MKISHFALVGAAALVLAACGSRDEDSLENMDLNASSQTDQLNALADDAANQAEAEAIGMEEQQEDEQANDSASDAAGVEPTEDPDENVSGM